MRNGGSEIAEHRCVLPERLLAYSASSARLRSSAGGFARLVVRPTTREMAADFFALIFHVESFNPRENMTNFVRAAFGQEGHKFVAAETHSEIGTANGALETLCETFDDKIAGSVAVAVVHQLSDRSNREAKR